MAGTLLANSFDQGRLARAADVAVVAMAVSLPWSTSAMVILAAVWFFALVPTVNWPSVRRQLATPPGGLPVLLVALGIAGLSYFGVYRPLQINWGVTEAEIARRMPGDELLSQPFFVATRAVTVATCRGHLEFRFARTQVLLPVRSMPR